jgi:membrane-associated protease RseP (regulator of RpoE activity)
MLSVFIMLGLISVLVIVHEMGHYYVARWCGVRVERFGFGLPFGPTLFRKKVGDTEFCLHAALFGGYVSFPDDNPESPVPKDSPERFENRPLWQRAAIALAGVTVNALVGWLLMLAVVMSWGLPSMDVVMVQPLTAQSPAAKAGIVGPELLLAINGTPVQGEMGEERLRFVTQTIGAHRNEPIQVTLKALSPQEFSPKNPKATKATQALPPNPVPRPAQWQPGVIRTVTVTPNNEGKIGVRLGSLPKRIRPDNFSQAAGLSTRFLGNFIRMNFEALGKIFTGQMDARQLSGPIGIVTVGAKIIEQDGIEQGLILTAIISVILAVMNLLPIPALDGGHLLFIVLEALRGKPLQKSMQEKVVQAGFIGLLAFMAFVLWNDIYNTWIHPVLSPNSSSDASGPP